MLPVAATSRHDVTSMLCSSVTTFSEGKGSAAQATTERSTGSMRCAG